MILDAQIGGELADGTIALLRAGQRYGAAALIRQLVEVEYLAAVFAGGSTIAADWMRTTRDERLKFWSPTKLRQLASREFLPSDYWTHCEFGGHPTPRALALLPDHSRWIHPRLLG